MIGHDGFASKSGILFGGALIIAFAVAPLSATTVRKISPATPPLKDSLPPAQLDATIATALSDGAGKRRAGLLCLPNGKLRVRDFASSAIAFRATVAQALDDRKSAYPALVANGTALSVSLVLINANLCARSWGAFGRGDRISLSGTTSVTFEWTFKRALVEHHATEQVTLIVPHDDAVAPEEILLRAVGQLVDKIGAEDKAA